MALLNKVSEYKVPSVIATLFHEVVLAAAVFLRRYVPIGVGDVARVDAIWAVLAAKYLLLLIKGKTMLLKSLKSVLSC